MLAAAFEDNSVRIWNLCELFGSHRRFTGAVSNESSASSDSEIDHTIPATAPKSTTFNSKKKEADLGGDTGWETTMSECSITEDELEPIETHVFNTAVRLPTPKIIPCDSSAILRLHYQDFAHLSILGRKVEMERPPLSEEEQVSPAARLTSFVLPSMEEEDEPSASYLPDSVRPALVTAGISRWPIPIEISSSDEEELSSGDGAGGGFKSPIEILDPANQALEMQIAEAFMRGGS